jgi:hypothetical protein
MSDLGFLSGMSASNNLASLSLAHNLITNIGALRIRRDLASWFNLFNLPTEKI